MQTDAPGLNGLAIHAIANGSGQVRRRGKRVHIGMDIDAVSYLTDILKTLKERRAPASLIQSVEKVIKNQSKFDPLKGSGKFIADTAFDEMLRQNDDKWPNRLNKGLQMGRHRNRRVGKYWFVAPNWIDWIPIGAGRLTANQEHRDVLRVRISLYP